MVDFSTLGLPGFSQRETHPRKIFDELPAGDERISNLWTGQERALNEWNDNRSKSDVVIELNTGAGKSLIGLLIAESAVREGRGKVLYVCPTIDLVEQVGREARSIGLRYSTRTARQWSNDLYLSGQAFGITTYDAVITSRTHFRGDRAPEMLIFDDAHVAEGKIREQYTVHVDRTLSTGINPQFPRLAELIIESAPDASWRARFENILRDHTPADPRIAPLNFGGRFKRQLDEIFSNAMSDASDPNFFTIEHIWGKWDRCIAVFNHESIDLLPPITPILSHPFFASREIRRVYLSATLTQESDFARAFGRKVRERVRPDVDAGDGERLVIMSRRFTASNEDEEAFVRRVVDGRKALFAVPSTAAAKRWSRLVTPVARASFTEELNAFRRKETGAFILVSRFDGIDLPGNQCRLMVIDKIPAGSSLLERFLFDRVNLRAELAAKIANRITQLFGRINRGRRDYGIYVVASEELKVWLSTDRNLALLPELLQKQIKLGSYMQANAEVNNSDKLIELVEQVLKRDEGWTTYYGNYLRSQELNKEQANFALQSESHLSELFLAQAVWFSRVWAGDFQAGTQAVEDANAKMSAYDQKASGVTDLWLGLVRELNADAEGATAFYESAHGRLLIELPFILTNAHEFEATDVRALDAFGIRQMKVLSGGINTVNGRLLRVRSDTLPLANWDDYTFRQLEEAVRALGEHIGFDAIRPDSESEIGPDVAWIDETKRQVLGIELKTNKGDESDLSKDEIGQCHNHENWLMQEYKSYEYLGLIVVTDTAGVSGKASPSGSMFQCTSGRLRDLRAKLLDALDSLKPSVRSGDLSALRVASDDQAWSLDRLADALKERSLQSLD